MDLAPFSALDDVWISEFATATAQPISASPWNTAQGFNSRDDNFKLASSPGHIKGEGIAPGLGSPIQGRKRNVSIAGFDSSPASASVESPDLNGDEHGRDGRRRPVKRACNECRQQKLRCDVVQEPFQICTRCRRLNLECKIEDNFKRVGKRSRNAEMEREIIELRKAVVAKQSGNTSNGNMQNGSASLHPSQSGLGSFGQDAAAAGLLDLREGKSPGRSVFKRLEDVSLTMDRVQDLFQRFFTFQHPFLPFLNPERTPEEYHTRSPLLFWTILTIGARHYTTEPELLGALSGPLTRLMWSTIAEVPQNYHIVKALILLCAWPLPTNSTSTDPTFMICGLMMQIAMQIGLHRPTHAQDFSKFRVELREVELQDRVVVWSVCNIVAQRICTAYGQPPLTMYDWTLGPKPIETNPNYELPAPIFNRLLIEKFVDKVSRTLYMNTHDPVGLATDAERPTYVSFLAHDLEELEDRLQDDTSPITQIYLKAAGLHMRLSAFFSPPSLPSYRVDLLKLYQATTDFLETCLNLESSISVSLPSTYSHGLSLSHATNYIFHMMLAAGFSLLKLMHNFLNEHELDTKGASELLSRTVWALRNMSTVENDLAERLAEVLAQVWKSGRHVRADSNGEGDDDSLQLKVKCRMSLSLVFDSVWRWRRNFQFKDGKPSDVRQQSAKLQQPDSIIIPTSSLDAKPSMNDPMLSSTAIVPGMAGMATGMVDDFSMDYGQASYDVFDPLNWMLDGIVDFPYNFSSVQGSDLSGMDGLGGGI
ncbi:transcriptional regulatory protein LEU3 [Exophiala viscosa]|uniref:transcriptional regulatory protein LEU3 n=1 Tax=Exophiala viscosa TaxID=2486360 RepID=UPI00219FB4C7|nr:transcriptional regulatory protein LEU3 [Exophiala viscosa]